ncbi:uncharacterized protein PV09_04085 [Verruconis gallopava]|uniref:Uncharacterized protein n=1 Tax=Verruconis gallopava TaxID=253628 RepID=A0A0D2AEP5_9PEZI|nr:uncharacterized protein PV09_04085 [Verruconis gallopava]KIW04915.1 hypothetical protein PV09_04085 [Verruconis gallopava]
MKAQLVAALATAAQAGGLGALFARQTITASGNQAYLNSVCSPNVTDTSGTLPPCISVINIQGECAPNNTDALGYLAMAECLCNPPSTFFADWLGCRDCLAFHGGLSDAALARYSVVISSVSNAICTGTPTAQFADYFTSVDAAVPGPTGTATGTTDQAPSQTAVSLYYTASGAQGPGAITGSATAATRSGAAASSVLSGTRSAAATTATSGATAASTSAGSSSSSSSSSGAMATAGRGLGLALVAAGGALVL